MTGAEWMQLMAGVGLLIALFAFPVISIWLDERRKRRANEPAIDAEQEEREYSQLHSH